MSTSRWTLLVYFLTALQTVAMGMGCQYDDPCGKDDLEHSRGVCFPRMPEPPPGTADASVGADGGMDEGGAVSTDPRCDATCDLFGRCVAANTEASAALMSELEQLGFKGTEPAGCAQKCDAKRAGSGDDLVLDCFAAENQTAMCAEGLVGALPAVNAVNKCCEKATKSEFCAYLCGLLLPNMTAGGFFTSCKALVP